jgi:hypothetical protein
MTRPELSVPAGSGLAFSKRSTGYNLLPFLTGKEKTCPPEGFIYFDDDGLNGAGR